MHGPTPPQPPPTDQLRFAMPPMHACRDPRRAHRKGRVAGGRGPLGGRGV
ncbi:class II aldolase/adducin family protein, partial [Streptomyces anthocyanicus]